MSVVNDINFRLSQLEKVINDTAILVSNIKASSAPKKFKAICKKYSDVRNGEK